MKTKKLFLVICLCFVIAALCFCGCGGTSTSGDYATLEEYFDQNPDMQEVFGESESSIEGTTYECAVSGNDLLYNFTYIEQVPDDQVEAVALEVEESQDGAQEGIQTLVDTMEELTGIEGVRVVVSFYNSDGSLIWSYSIPE